jgi:hypothetical protein
MFLEDGARWYDDASKWVMRFQHNKVYGTELMKNIIMERFIP